MDVKKPTTILEARNLIIRNLAEQGVKPPFLIHKEIEESAIWLLENWTEEWDKSIKT